MVQTAGPVNSSYGLHHHGLAKVGLAHWNYAAPALYEQALERGEGRIAAGGGLVTHTGIYTGRSPRDKFFVNEETSRDTIDWGAVNQPISEDHFDTVLQRMLRYFRDKEVFVQDCFAGADPAYSLPIRIVTETAWHSLFAHNMFSRPPPATLRTFQPQFTVLHAPGFHSVPETDGTRSEVCVLVSFARRLVVIGGSHYTGEIKKSIFTILNYLLPDQGVMPMHCSANIGSNGDTAIFFGLSGTGKTTLSADSRRTLIGDDEHGWSDRGVFNFEGGCYAKTIRLSATAEPQIFAACHRFGTVLENVMMDGQTRALDFDDESLTENTRASYPLSFIANASATGMGGHPSTIIMLTADAFGVLPPISRMSAEQAMYHFLSGYTARVAGTERGMGDTPEATFSTCFGAPFMPRHPTVYARLLGEKIARHKASCWLVNTGWSGGSYGVGSRMKIAHTRAMVRAALDGKLDDVPAAPDRYFGVAVPEHCPDVPPEVLKPREAWRDKQRYDATASGLAKRFESNFKQFESHVDDKIRAAAICAVA